MNKHEFELGEIVQFNENHKWFGVIGFIVEIKNDNSGRMLIGIPMPTNGAGTDTTYIYGRENEVEKTGGMVRFVPVEEG